MTEPLPPESPVALGLADPALQRFPDASVLVAEDSPGQLRMIIDQLQPLVGCLESASTGIQALRKAREKVFDLVTLDLELPGLSGLELLRAIKQIRPAAKILVLTANANLRTAVEAMRLGAYDYVTKPILGDDLATRVHRALETESMKAVMARIGRELNKVKAESRVFYEALSDATALYETKVREFSLLRRISESLSRSLTLETVYDLTLNVLLEEMHVESCSIMLLDADREYLTLVAGRSQQERFEEYLARGGEGPPAARHRPASAARFRLGDGIAGHVALTGEALLVEDAASDPRFQPLTGNRQPIGSLLCLPLASGDDLIGVLNLSHPEPAAFTEDNKRMLTITANLAAVAVTNAQLFEQLRALNDRLQEAIREQERVQTQLITAEKMSSLGQLVSGIAHDLNSPLGAIRSNSEVMLRLIRRAGTGGGTGEAAAADPTLLGRLERLGTQNLEAIRLISGTIDSLMRFARLDRPEVEEADLHDGLRTTVGLLGHQLGERIEVCLDLGDLPKIRCYSNQVNQVILNLLLNAIQAIDGEGKITVRTSCEGDRAVIAVSDTGRGIAAENLPRIFEPGFTTKGAGIGTGLGLAICYQIVRRHLGEIHVESKLGQGATFWVRLPIDGVSAGEEGV